MTCGVPKSVLSLASRPPRLRHWIERIPLWIATNQLPTKQSFCRPAQDLRKPSSPISREVSYRLNDGTIPEEIAFSQTLLGLLSIFLAFLHLGGSNGYLAPSTCSI
ncbi:hypothetical protein SCHPADRAFT_418993 [Schizopora paradoxa]|uniref:Uncharacterized protein n=1 Tax=Schizopora paradoxa TaxID=27342 RepID=A0A0H2RSK6_9AGAM|nr:hypothetical protein SCHPADRAFT_418993 [Schizopora paradoxa]